MVSAIGYMLNNPKKITGFGRCRTVRRSRGRGVIRNVTSGVVRTLGTTLVNKLADAIKGTGIRRRRHKRAITAGSYKLTGMGRRPRKTLRRRRI